MTTTTPVSLAITAQLRAQQRAKTAIADRWMIRATSFLAFLGAANLASL